MARQRPDILDVTLRDGAYLIDFQFTSKDTAKIAGALESVGVGWVEIGHGLGLNASESGKGRAAASDEEYMQAACETLTNAKWGMFCIPGIAELAHLDIAARYGMPFVRIGTDITKLEDAEPFIKHAKHLGMVVSYNAMKSYVVTPEKFGQLAAIAWSWGADIVCLVDSAGGMMPHDVNSYMTRARQCGDGDLGFHGHDNLSMAMANTLQAVENGAVLVDASLQGVGRSAGNTITEALVAILKQKGLCPEIDLKGIMDIGQALVTPITGVSKVNSLAITSGYAMFHSSFTPKVVAYARRYGLDVRDVIISLANEDRVNAPDGLLDKICKNLVDVRVPRTIFVPTNQTEQEHFNCTRDRLLFLAKEVSSKSVRLKKYSAINIVIGDQPMDDVAVSGNIHNSSAYIIGSVTLTSEKHLFEALQLLDGLVDVVFLDIDRKEFGPASVASTAGKVLKKTRFLTYFDSRVWFNSVEDQVVRLLNEKLANITTMIFGDHPKSRFLALRLAERGSSVTLVGKKRKYDGTAISEEFSMMPSEVRIECLSENDLFNVRERVKQAELIIAWLSHGELLDEDLAKMISRKAIVVDAGMGSLKGSTVEVLRSMGVSPVRLNIWPSLASALESAHESERVVREDLGFSIFNGVPVVAGGTLGIPGDVVVDSINHPTRVIGVVNEKGGLSFDYSGKAQHDVQIVMNEIERKILEPRPDGHFRKNV